MAWRPTENLIEGELDNTVLGKVTGYMKFAGMKETVKFYLNGDFHRDIRGTKIKLTGEGENREVDGHEEGENYMKAFSPTQTGDVGDITAGIPTGKDADGNPTYEYSSTPYVEWYSQENGRCVLELSPDQIEIIGTPIPVSESDPIDRKKQAENMEKFIFGLMKNMSKKS
jgi:hypothetical protein